MTDHQTSQPTRALWILFTGLSIIFLIGCGHQHPRPLSKDELIIRTNATIYRDAFVSGFSVAGSEDVTTNLAQTTIQSVELLPAGWHVVFAKKTGPHKYVLDVYIKDSGALDKIERRPDS